MQQAPSVTFWRDRRVRSFLAQALFLAAIGFLIYAAAANAIVNMRAHGIPTDYRFWDEVSGFDINQSLIAYSAKSTYGRAFFVGLLNTLLVAAIGVVLASIIGFLVGMARLSANPVTARFAEIYVETIRNVPLLLQLLFWYNAVLSTLPAPRQSLSLRDAVYLNIRGLYVPIPIWSAGWAWVAGALGMGLVAALACKLWARRRRLRSGRPQRWGSLVAVLLIFLPPLAACGAFAGDLNLSLPQLKGLNFIGGIKLVPEFVALLFGLVLYTAAFIAEIVRAGIEAVPKGQSEAAAALGLSAAQSRKYVIVPQAMRVIIPPLTSQYLNLLKNSSLAVFIGYPDLVQTFMGTVLNQTGAAIQIIGLTMAVYLTISLLTSAAMNLYNRRIALVER
jgi:general L-amino acid transport system permease protein